MRSYLYRCQTPVAHQHVQCCGNMINRITENTPAPLRVRTSKTWNCHRPRAPGRIIYFGLYSHTEQQLLHTTLTCVSRHAIQASMSRTRPAYNAKSIIKVRRPTSPVTDPQESNVTRSGTNQLNSQTLRCCQRCLPYECWNHNLREKFPSPGVVTKNNVATP